MAKGRRHRHRYSRRAARTCEVTTVSFTTKRGKRIVFRGRRAGSSAHGGKCTPKRATGRQLAIRRKLASSGRACAKFKPGTGANKTCLRAWWKAHG